MLFFIKIVLFNNLCLTEMYKIYCFETLTLVLKIILLNKYIYVFISYRTQIEKLANKFFQHPSGKFILSTQNLSQKFHHTISRCFYFTIFTIKYFAKNNYELKFIIELNTFFLISAIFLNMLQILCLQTPIKII